MKNALEHCGTHKTLHKWNGPSNLLGKDNRRFRWRSREPESPGVCTFPLALTSWVTLDKTPLPSQPQFLCQEGQDSTYPTEYTLSMTSLPSFPSILSPSLTLLQPCWPPHCSPDTPQGLCTCLSFCLEQSFPRDPQHR